VNAAHLGLARWHTYMQSGGDLTMLSDLLAENAVFHSPVVHTPQTGKAKVMAYLSAASQTLGNDTFRYAREVVDGDCACLEFTTEMDGIIVNGIDLITWSSDGKITDFKVMVRPLKAMNKVWEAMATQLQSGKG
jgi:ketosteroid isomerase-like protein